MDAAARRAMLATVAAASVVVLSGCVPVFPTGPLTTQERDIDAVTRVVLSAPGDLTVTTGDPMLTIRAQRDVLARLTSDVDGDVLVLGLEPGWAFALGEIDYELSVPSLEQIEVNGSGDVVATGAADTAQIIVRGSGDVEWSGIDADRTGVVVAGSGDIALAGTSAELEIEVDGSGDVGAEDLRADDARVVIRGSGDVDVTANDTLAVEITGSGRVTYAGDPSVEADIAGSGDVVRR